MRRNTSGETHDGPDVAREMQARVQASFERQGLMRHLGARVAHVAPGIVRIELPARPQLTQQHGYFHAGATAAVADSAGGYAALTLLPENSEVLAVEFQINLLRPALGDHLEAVGTVLKSGRTLTVCRIDVFGVRAERRAHVAAAQQTVIRIEGAPQH